VPNFSIRQNIFIEKLNLTLLPEQVFAHWQKQSWSIWLDSSDSNHSDAQFDILCHSPVVTFETQGKQTKITDTISGETLFSDEDPLALLENYQRRFFKSPHKTLTAELPFIGGALGYFSYDLGRRFEQLPSLAEDDIALPEMAVGIYLTALIYNRRSKEYFLVSHDENAEKLKSDFEAFEFSNLKSKFLLTSKWHSNLSKQDYVEKFNQVQEYLLSGDCYQINLTQRFSAGYQGDEFAAYLALREANQAPFSAFIRLPESAILSISPERFLKVSGDKVQTKPIKGTRPRSTDAAIDKANANELQQASKDRAENLMIVDLLRNDISKACQPGTVKVPHLFAIESFPAVHHLVSTVEGVLAKGESAADLLRGAFPGGSITGAPKIRAMEIIEELEPHRRSVYCGSIGYLSACGNMDTSITIRTLICHNSNIYCWAGGGLVADSKASSEYQETFDKVSKILPVLENI
jgi:para-aminobenzoate synthetase component 1